MYKPLPPYLTIEKSDIHGLGIFATSDIQIGANLGIAHVELPNFPQEHCRTPLGGFYNHSDEPNCIKIESPEQSMLTYYSLVTTRDIEQNEELTVAYTLYNV